MPPDELAAVCVKARVAWCAGADELRIKQLGPADDGKMTVEELWFLPLMPANIYSQKNKIFK